MAEVEVVAEGVVGMVAVGVVAALVAFLARTTVRSGTAVLHAKWYSACCKQRAPTHPRKALGTNRCQFIRMVS